MHPRPDLNFRARKILYATISEYIATGEPVGSRRVAKRYGLNLSPATVRNVLSDLEEAGLLQQPHTSAGRIPTDQGFRVFVDALIQIREITAADRAAVNERMGEIDPSESDFLREAGQLLSRLSGAAAVITAPRAEEETLAQLRFMPLRPRQLLAVIVTRSGAVQNRAIEVDHDFESASLERVNNYLTEHVSGMRLEDLRSRLSQEVEKDRALHLQACAMVEAAATGTSDRSAGVLIEGQGRLFDRAEFESADKIKGFLRTFEAREVLVGLLDRTMLAGGVHVLIGSEAELDGISDISLITARYGSDAGGTVGIIGPARMDYAKLVPLVGFTADYMSRRLGTDDEDE